MRWRKLGRIFAADGQRNWLNGRAQVPIAAPHGENLRIYFSSRDRRNRSQVGWLELDPRDPLRVVALADMPCLEPGGPGSFDEYGSIGSWIIDDAKTRTLYYFGYSSGTSGSYSTAIGLGRAPLPDDRAYERRPEPVIEASQTDPILCAFPCVLKQDDAWHVWYAAGDEWIDDDEGGPGLSYGLRHAVSTDGADWHDKTAIDFGASDADRIGATRPCVLADDDVYRMWYCERGRSTDYRIRYTESVDGVHWSPGAEQVGLEPSPSGWDSEMMAYPFVLDHEGQRYMFYCGNGYGRAGFGVAILERD